MADCLVHITVFLLASTILISLQFYKSANGLGERYTLYVLPIRMMQIDGKVNRGEISWEQSSKERNAIILEANYIERVEKAFKYLFAATLVTMGTILALYVFDQFYSIDQGLQICAVIGIIMALSELTYLKFGYRKAKQVFDNAEGISALGL